MEPYVYQASDAKELKKTLEADPLSETSFSRLGYILREGKAYGLDGYVLYFTTEDGKSEPYKKQLSAVADCAEVTGKSKQKVVDGILGEQDNAAEGFGSLFG